MIGISEKDYGDLLDLICEAALEPTAWARVLRRLAEHTGCVAGGLTIENPETGRGFPLTFFGFDPDHVRNTFDYFLPQNPLHAIEKKMLPGRVVTNAMAIALDDFRRTEFYDGWAKPQGLCCPVTVVLQRNGAVYAPLTLVRPDGTGDAGDRDCALLARLAPHLIRALKTGMQLQRLEARSDALDLVLTHLGIATFVVDERGRIAFANPKAEQMLRSNCILSVDTERRLAAVDRGSNAQLQAAMFNVLRSHEAGADVHLTTSEGHALVATVLSLSRSRVTDVMGRDMPAGLIIIHDSSQHDTRSIAKQAARLYKLTPAEERVLTFVLKGEGLTQAAALLGVSRATAQTHLRGIFHKTGTRRQGELIGLTSRLPPPWG